MYLVKCELFVPILLKTYTQTQKDTDFLKNQIHTKEGSKSTKTQDMWKNYKIKETLQQKTNQEEIR